MDLVEISTERGRRGVRGAIEVSTDRKLELLNDGCSQYEKIRN
jgi:hypothetical protein